MAGKTGKNLTANFIGKFYAAFINLAFVPLYIKFIGVEGYGLVGFYATLQAVFNLLDMGFSSTLKRELACASESDKGALRSGDFLATMQWLYFAIAVLVCVLMLLVSPLISRYWLTSADIPMEILGEIVALFGFIIATQMMYGFYSGGLLGLQKQVLYNWVNSIFVTVRSGGAVLVLWFISPTVTGFFAWQALCGLAVVVTIAYLLWTNLPKRSRRAKFKFNLLHDVWKYTAGLGVNSLLGLMLTQVDKIVLSKMMPLEMFGYYAIAGTISSSLQYLGAPVNTTFFPAFVRSVTDGLLEKLSIQYHKATQIITVAVFPFAGIFIFLSWQLIFAWTKNVTIANNTWLLTSLLSLSMALNIIASMPYNLQLAWKYTRFSVIANSVAVVFLGPALYFGIKSYGAVGAAMVSVVLNFSYVLVFAQVVHKKFLMGQSLKWYFEDIFPIVIAVSFVGVMALLVLPDIESRLFLILALTFVWICMFIVAILSSSLVRKSILSTANNFFLRKH